MVDFDLRGALLQSRNEVAFIVARCRLLLMLWVILEQRLDQETGGRLDDLNTSGDNAP